MKHLLVMICAMGLTVITGCQVSPVRTSGSVDVVSDNARIRVAFSDRDRELIRQYYAGTKHRKMPPGLAKKNRLPPGLEKQLVRNGKLPPGLEGRYLPVDLERRLEPLRGSYVRMQIGTDIVLVDQNTRVILDVISGIAF